MIDMSIENMVKVSYMLFAASGVSAVSAVILFFALDITKCWRMVLRRGSVYKKMQKNGRIALKRRSAAEYSSDRETVPLDQAGQEETALFNGDTLELNLTKL